VKPVVHKIRFKISRSFNIKIIYQISRRVVITWRRTIPCRTSTSKDGPPLEDDQNPDDAARTCGAATLYMQ
jgi:hypothetical protein